MRFSEMAQGNYTVWKDEETRRLIKVVASLNVMSVLKGKRQRNGEIFEKVVEELGLPNKSVSHCRNKFKKLKARYKAELAEANKSGGVPSTWPFYDLMDSLMSVHDIDGDDSYTGDGPSAVGTGKGPFIKCSQSPANQPDAEQPPPDDQPAAEQPPVAQRTDEQPPSADRRAAEQPAPVDQWSVEQPQSAEQPPPVDQLAATRHVTVKRRKKKTPYRVLVNCLKKSDQAHARQMQQFIESSHRAMAESTQLFLAGVKDLFKTFVPLLNSPSSTSQHPYMPPTSSQTQTQTPLSPPNHSFMLSTHHTSAFSPPPSHSFMPSTFPQTTLPPPCNTSAISSSSSSLFLPHSSAQTTLSAPSHSFMTPTSHTSVVSLSTSHSCKSPNTFTSAAFPPPNESSLSPTPSLMPSNCHASAVSRPPGQNFAKSNRQHQAQMLSSSSRTPSPTVSTNINSTSPIGSQLFSSQTSSHNGRMTSSPPRTSEVTCPQPKRARFGDYL